MTEQTDSPARTPEIAEPAGGSAPTGGGTSPAEADAAAADEGFAERPEVLVAGAFAGGLLLAIVLRSLGRG